MYVCECKTEREGERVTVLDEGSGLFMAQTGEKS